MAAGNRWTRDQLLIVLNLYHKLRFGQLDSRQPVIIDLANRMGRTSGSVAMKLNNLASLDLRVILSKKLKTTLPREAIVHQFEFYEGKSLILPEDGTHPEVSFLSAHRKLLIC
jgi:hypothetical protein